MKLARIETSCSEIGRIVRYCDAVGGKIPRPVHTQLSNTETVELAANIKQFAGRARAYLFAGNWVESCGTPAGGGERSPRRRTNEIATRERSRVAPKTGVRKRERILACTCICTQCNSSWNLPSASSHSVEVALVRYGGDEMSFFLATALGCTLLRRFVTVFQGKAWEKIGLFVLK
ncbi:hypothetical protein EVAR_97723_1 [Eumeta japonica]|uniref:Uncharacterized protein n=1 Tax=Eumeta variegata TaxID=151549 RepID=A0A4C1XXM7_EUMVA|nr:hypothetical protein EVAR_97723_1 [Eumeta japonica]